MSRCGAVWRYGGNLEAGRRMELMGTRHPSVRGSHRPRYGAVAHRMFFPVLKPKKFYELNAALFGGVSLKLAVNYLVVSVCIESKHTQK